MPAKPRWLLFIPDAISQLEQLDRGSTRSLPRPTLVPMATGKRGGRKAAARRCGSSSELPR